MNLLTFDIEEWCLQVCHMNRAEKFAEFDCYLNQILDKLDERKLKATFFCMGEMASQFPQVVRLIHEHGHEIGCHSNTHSWLNKMTEKACIEDTHCAVERLEQCIGEKVLSYRAPAFSINEDNLWVFDILAENGITRDASVFPAHRDFGGFANFGQKKPCQIEHNGITLKEFPVCTVKVLGKETAYSGGGYFRFFPLGFIKKEMRRSEYAICYFHIGDLTPESGGIISKEQYEEYFKEPGTLKARYSRYIKSNLGKRGAMTKMKKLVDTMEFINLQQADETLDWMTLPKISL